MAKGDYFASGLSPVQKEISRENGKERPMKKSYITFPPQIPILVSQ
jgi:hypothetical protein